MYVYSDMLNFLLTTVYNKLKGEVHNWSNFYVLTYQVYHLSIALEIDKNVFYHKQFLWLFYIKKQFFFANDNTSLSSLLKCNFYDILQKFVP